MNIVFVMSDTFRRDNLNCYGASRAKTPRLDQLASQSFIFDNAAVGSFPTLPNRTDIMSGRFSFIDSQWGPLSRQTITLQQILSASGITTMLIADNPHLVEDGNNYCRGFNGWDWIRGQESDLWYTSPKNPHMPNDQGKNKGRNAVLENILRNSSWWKCEEDRHAPRSIQSACRWLESNQDQDKFFLWIDLFDPHEPWDAPKHYLDLYEKEYHGAELLYPHYGFWKEFLTAEEIQHCRNLYLAEVSMVDHWVGVLLDKLDELGLTEDTAVIFTSDHGFLLGEKDFIGKARHIPKPDGSMQIEAQRQWNDIRRVPLLVRLPGQVESKTVPALVQSPDLMPTILEMAGLVSTQGFGSDAKIQAHQCGTFVNVRWTFDPATIHGRSLMPILRGETARHRDITVSSHTLLQHTPYYARCAIATEDGWVLHYSGCYDLSSVQGKIRHASVVGSNESRVPIAPALYNINTDPNEERDVIESNEPLAREIHQRYVRFLEEIKTPEENLAGRRMLR